MTAPSDLPAPAHVVSEVSTSWRDDEHPTRDTIAEAFELAIADRLRRGYRLSDWRFCQVATRSAAGVPGGCETIVAVFERYDHAQALAATGTAHLASCSRTWSPLPEAWARHGELRLHECPCTCREWRSVAPIRIRRAAAERAACPRCGLGYLIPNAGPCPRCGSERPLE